MLLESIITYIVAFAIIFGPLFYVIASLVTMQEFDPTPIYRATTFYTAITFVLYTYNTYR